MSSENPCFIHKITVDPIQAGVLLGPVSGNRAESNQRFERL